MIRIRRPGADAAKGSSAAFYAANLVRSITFHSSGSWYFEVTVNAATDITRVGVGLDNNSESLVLAAGRLGGICWLGNGAVNYNGVPGYYAMPSFNVGDVLGIDANLTAGTMRGRVNGNAFSNNLSIAGIIGGSPLYALAQLSNPVDQVTANFTGASPDPAFAHTAPSTAWG